MSRTQSWPTGESFEYFLRRRVARAPLKWIGAGSEERLVKIGLDSSLTPSTYGPSRPPLTSLGTGLCARRALGAGSGRRHRLSLRRAKSRAVLAYSRWQRSMTLSLGVSLCWRHCNEAQVTDDAISTCQIHRTRTAWRRLPVHHCAYPNCPNVQSAGRKRGDGNAEADVSDGQRRHHLASGLLRDCVRRWDRPRTTPRRPPERNRLREHLERALLRQRHSKSRGFSGCPPGHRWRWASRREHPLRSGRREREQGRDRDRLLSRSALCGDERSHCTLCLIPGNRCADSTAR